MPGRKEYHQKSKESLVSKSITQLVKTCAGNFAHMSVSTIVDTMAKRVRYWQKLIKLTIQVETDPRDNLKIMRNTVVPTHQSRV